MQNIIDHICDYIVESIKSLRYIIYNKNNKIKYDFIYETHNFDPLRDILRERFLNS